MVLAAIAEAHGDVAVVLLKAGAETDKKDVDGFLPLDLAPDEKVSFGCWWGRFGGDVDLRCKRCDRTYDTWRKQRASTSSFPFQQPTAVIAFVA